MTNSLSNKYFYKCRLRLCDNVSIEKSLLHYRFDNNKNVTDDILLNSWNFNDLSHKITNFIKKKNTFYTLRTRHVVVSDTSNTTIKRYFYSCTHLYIYIYIFYRFWDCAPPLFLQCDFTIIIMVKSKY